MASQSQKAMSHVWPINLAGMAVWGREGPWKHALLLYYYDYILYQKRERSVCVCLEVSVWVVKKGSKNE